MQWEDFTTPTQWERLISTLQRELKADHFEFCWKSINFSYTLYRNDSSEHFIGAISGISSFAVIEQIGREMFVGENEARCLLSALVCALNCAVAYPLFCQFNVGSQTNYLGYASYAHFISHSLDYVPQNVSSVEGLVLWTREKLQLLSGAEEELELCSVWGCCRWRVALSEAVSGPFICAEAKSIFGIGCWANAPIESVELQCEYSGVEFTDSSVENAHFCMFMQPKEPKLWLFSRTLRVADAHLRAEEVLLPKDIHSTEGGTLQDFGNLYAFLFEGKAMSLQERLVECMIFVLQRDAGLLWLFWRGFVQHLRASLEAQREQVVSNAFEVTKIVDSNLQEAAESGSICLFLARIQLLSVSFRSIRQAKKKGAVKEKSMSLNVPFTIEQQCLSCHNAQILSDIQAFKAANPDADFAQFVCWFSPEDWNEATGELSPRMQNSSHWQQLWQQAEPAAIAHQPEMQLQLLDALEEALSGLSAVSLQEMLQFYLPRSLVAFQRALAKESEEFALKVRVFGTLGKNFCWPEYLLDANQVSLSEIIEEAMLLECEYTLKEWQAKNSIHFEPGTVHELDRDTFCRLRQHFGVQKPVSSNIRIIAEPLKVYALILSDEFKILEELTS